MANEVMQQGSLNVAVFKGDCEACEDRGRAYRITGGRGFVNLCAGCLHTVFFAVEAYEQDSHGNPPEKMS